MAQWSDVDLVPATDDGVDVANQINNLREAFLSGSLGTAAPGNAEKGMLWAKDVSGDVEIYCHDGSDDVLIGTIDASDDAFLAAGTTAFTRGLLDDANAAAARATLGNAHERIASDVVTGATLSQIVVEVPSDFQTVILDVQGFVPSSSGANLAVQVGTGTAASPTWQTSYEEVFVQGNGTAVTTGQSFPTAVSITPNTNSTPGPNSSRVVVTGMNASGFCEISAQCGSINSTPEKLVATIHGHQATSAVRTVLRIIPSTGTITAMRYQVHGVRAA
jgi:hypothetical protein